MDDCSLVKKIIHSMGTSGNMEDEREQLESYKIATASLSILITLLVISSIIRDTIEIRFGDIYPFSNTKEIFLYIGIVGLVGSYLLCKKGAVGINSSGGILIFGISFPIYFGSILSDVLLESIFSDLQNSQKGIIQLGIIIFMFIFAFVIYFVLNKVYQKSIVSSED